MNKINYDKHDWVDREPITQTLFNNIEGGIGRATSSTNLLVDRTNQEEESLSTIEGKIEHQDMEFDIAIGEHDTLDERLKADVSRFVEVWSGGNYMPFEGKNIRIDNSKVGWIRDFKMSGETYQNMITGVISADEGVSYSNGKITINTTITDSNVKIGAILELKCVKPNTKYTIVYNVSKNTNNAQCWIGGEDNEHNLVLEERLSDENDRKVFTSRSALANDITLPIFILGDNGTTHEVVIDNLMLFEGDYTDKEIPSSHIDGIVSAGELKDGGQYEIEILSHSKNLLNCPLIGGDIDVSTGWVGVDVENESHAINADFTEVLPNKTVTLSYTPIVQPKWFSVFYYDKDKNYISYNDTTLTFVTPTNCRYIRFKIENFENVNINDCQLEYSSTKTSYVPHKEDKTQILLDEPLMKLSDGTCDTIEQRDDGVYLVQRIGRIVLSEEEIDRMTEITGQPNETTIYLRLNEFTTEWTPYNVNPEISNLPFKKLQNIWVSDMEGMCYNYQKKSFQIRILRSRLEVANLENAKNYLKSNGVEVHFKLAEPIETQLDLDMSKWLTYQDVTYFTTTCNVQPTLSLKAPVDIQATVSNLQATNLSLRRNNQQLEQENQQAEKELNTLQEQCDQQTADLLDMDMRVLMLEE